MHGPPVVDRQHRRTVTAWLLAQARREPQHAQRWLYLQAAHVLGQPELRLHARVHGQMLLLAWRQRDAGEILGQLMRLVLTPMGHLSGRLPAGNSGRSDVSASATMDPGPALAAVITRARQECIAAHGP